MWKKRVEIFLMSVLSLGLGFAVFSSAPDEIAKIIFPPFVILSLALFFCFVISLFRQPRRTQEGVILIAIGAVLACAVPLSHSTMIPGGSPNFLERGPLLSAVAGGSPLIMLALIVFGVVRMFSSGQRRALLEQSGHSNRQS